MAGEWKTSSLDELLEDVLDRRGVTPLKLGSDFTNAGHRVISAKLMKNGCIDLTADEARFVDTVTYKRWMKTPLHPDDVILTSEAPLGEVAYIRTELDWCLGQRLFGLRTKKNRLDGRFLYYALQSESVRHDLLSRATGTVAQGIRQTELLKVRLPEPPIGEQRAIAHILGTLDDKIELNRRMNEALEAIARAMFKSWFVDFDPVRAKMNGEPHASICQRLGLTPDLLALFPDRLVDSELGEIPEGWEVKELGDIVEVVDCLHAKKPERCNSGFPFLQLNNIRDDGLIDMKDTYLISDTDYRKWVSRMEAREGDCVITNVGRVGAVAQIPPKLNAALGRNMTGIRCKPEFAYPTFLIECLLSDAMREEINRKMDTGTILNALNVRNIPKLRLVLASHQVLSRFEMIGRPLRQDMELNLAQAQTLSSLRDTLLPKLLSGDLRVSCSEEVFA
jgi:type I restriction enzyme S subunit